MVTGFDIDDEALGIAQENLTNMELTEEMDLIKADISQLKLSKTKSFDTVIMNPPFGTRKAGIDIAFLKKAVEVKLHIYLLKISYKELFRFSLFFA